MSRLRQKDRLLPESGMEVSLRQFSNQAFLLWLTFTGRQHLFSDLRPYICCQIQCTQGSEPCRDKEAWTRHLETIHDFTWTSIRCPLCPEMIRDGQKNVTVHLARHLEEISLWCLPEAGQVEPERKPIGEEGLTGSRDNPVDLTAL